MNLLSSQAGALNNTLRNQYLEGVGELNEIESRVNFVSTKMQSNDQTVAATDRPSMGRNRTDFYDLCKRWDISFVILFFSSNNSVHTVDELVSDGI